MNSSSLIRCPGNHNVVLPVVSSNDNAPSLEKINAIWRQVFRLDAIDLDARKILDNKKISLHEKASFCGYLDQLYMGPLTSKELFSFSETVRFLLLVPTTVEWFEVTKAYRKNKRVVSALKLGSIQRRRKLEAELYYYKTNFPNSEVLDVIYDQILSELRRDVLYNIPNFHLLRRLWLNEPFRHQLLVAGMVLDMAFDSGEDGLRRILNIEDTSYFEREQTMIAEAFLKLASMKNKKAERYHGILREGQQQASHGKLLFNPLYYIWANYVSNLTRYDWFAMFYNKRCVSDHSRVVRGYFCLNNHIVRPSNFDEAIAMSDFPHTSQRNIFRKNKFRMAKFNEAASLFERYSYQDSIEIGTGDQHWAFYGLMSVGYTKLTEWNEPFSFEPSHLQVNAAMFNRISVPVLEFLNGYADDKKYLQWLQTPEATAAVKRNWHSFASYLNLQLKFVQTPKMYGELIFSHALSPLFVSPKSAYGFNERDLAKLPSLSNGQIYSPFLHNTLDQLEAEKLKCMLHAHNPGRSLLVSSIEDMNRIAIFNMVKPAFCEFEVPDFNANPLAIVGPRSAVIQCNNKNIKFNYRKRKTGSYYAYKKTIAVQTGTKRDTSVDDWVPKKSRKLSGQSTQTTSSDNGVLLLQQGAEDKLHSPFQQADIAVDADFSVPSNLGTFDFSDHPDWDWDNWNLSMNYDDGFYTHENENDEYLSLVNSFSVPSPMLGDSSDACLESSSCDPRGLGETPRDFSSPFGSSTQLSDSLIHGSDARGFEGHAYNGIMGVNSSDLTEFDEILDSGRLEGARPARYLVKRDVYSLSSLDVRSSNVLAVFYLCCISAVVVIFYRIQRHRK